jgi:hypothetical protein
MPHKIVASLSKWAKAFVQALCVIALLALPLVYANRDHRRLVAEYSVQKADIGIPGITKMYQARLINRGFLPAHIQVCAYVEDSGYRGSTPAFSIERFDSEKKVWRTIADLSSLSYCRPYPLGWNTASTQSIWLWPGQFSAIEEEATGARGYLKGASLRFVLFDSFDGAQKRKGFVTPSFIIEEQGAGLFDAPQVAN